MSRKVWQKLIKGLQKNQKPLTMWFLKSVFLPTFTTLIAFFLFLFLFQVVTGITRAKYAPAQITSAIEKEVGTGNTNYEVKKIDFHGFGTKSIVVLLNSVENFENGETTDETTKGTALIVMDEIQPNPIEQFLFSEKLYSTSFKYLPSDSRFFTHSEVIQDSNGREVLVFCISNACGILHYSQGKYVIDSLISDSFGICAKDVEIDSYRLSLIPNESNLYFDESGDIAYIATPISDDTKSIWNNSQLYWERSRFQICKHLRIEGQYIQLADHGGEFCYQTKDYYFKSLYGGAFYEDRVVAFPYVDLEKEVRSNDNLIWWQDSLGYENRDYCEFNNDEAESV